MLICICIVSAAYLGIFFFIGLGLGASCWLVLGVACLLLFAWGLVQLLHGRLLPQCLAAFVQRLCCPCYIFQLLVWALRRLVIVGWWSLVAGYAFPG